ASWPSAVIRYTLDGSEPTAGSRKYSGPIQIADSTLLKTTVFGGGASNSAVAAQTYILVNADLAAFDSNLPLILINSFRQSIPKEQKVMVSARFIEARSGRNSLMGPADFDGRGELNVRGHTSLRYPKHSFHFKAKDDALNPLKAS